MVRMLMTNDDDDDKDEEDTEADEDLSTERIPRSHPAPERGTQLHLRRNNQENDNLAFDQHRNHDDRGLDDHHDQNYDHQNHNVSHHNLNYDNQNHIDDHHDHNLIMVI